MQKRGTVRRERKWWRWEKDPRFRLKFDACALQKSSRCGRWKVLFVEYSFQQMHEIPGVVRSRVEVILGRSRVRSDSVGSFWRDAGNEGSQ